MIVKKALPEQIYELVRERILSGEAQADTPVRQDTLAAELGVSKIPLREALGRLEQDGLIISQANRGFFVSPLSPAEAMDVFDLRLRIEPAAVTEAAGLAGKTDHAAARDAMVVLNREILAHGPQVGVLNREFHTALIRPTRRRITIQTIERLQVIAERYVRRHLESREREPRAVREHEAMFDAWSRGDGDTAGRLAEAHIRATLDDLREEFARNLAA